LPFEVHHVFEGDVADIAGQSLAVEFRALRRRVDLGSGIESVERAGGIDDGSAGIDGTATVCTAMQQSRRRVTATASICLLSTHYLTTFYLRRAISWWIRRPSSQNLARQA
jgi:hypothetical protein